jgi:hypothetical protein
LPETTINKVIEIMRDAASQLTDKVEFLGMPKHCFRLAAIGNLVAEAPVGVGAR